MNNANKTYIDGTVRKANIRNSKAGNPVLNLGVETANGEYEWVSVTLIPKLMERNLPTLERALGHTFTEGTPSEIFNASERGLLRPMPVRLAIVDDGSKFPTKYVNDPRTIKVFDNREGTDTTF